MTNGDGALSGPAGPLIAFVLEKCRLLVALKVMGAGFKINDNRKR